MNLISKISGTLRKLKRSNYFALKKYAKLRELYLNSDFLKSSRYEQLFTKYYNEQDPFDAYLNDAEDEGRNYKFRHQDLAHALGSWRWKGVYQNRKKLIPVIFDKEKQGIDFGGAYGPISPHTTIVDFNTKDLFGRNVEYKNLSDIPFQSDYLFSSHTLEHIKELDVVLADIKKVLKANADVFLNLPSYTCLRWRNGWHSNKKFNDHQWTFYLAEDKKAQDLDLPNMLAIDSQISKFFQINQAEYVGDNSIFIHATNLS